MKKFTLISLAAVAMAMAPMAANALDANDAAIVIPEQEIIYEAPEGEVVYYNRVGTSLAMENGYVVEIPQEGQIEVVKGNDGYVYLKDLVTFFTPGTYVRGVQNGDMITVPMGQRIHHWDGLIPYNAEIWACTISRNIFGSILLTNYVLRDTEVSEVNFLIAGDNLILQDSDNKHGIGVFYDDTRRWAGYADYKDETTVVELPLKPETPKVLTYEADEENCTANITCEVPTVSVDGIELDPELLRYRLYLDVGTTEPGSEYQAYEFDPEVYGLAEPTTEMPYTFDNGLNVTAGGATVQLQSPILSDVYYVGIQSIYYGMRRLVPRMAKGDVFTTPITEPDRSDIYWLQIKDYDPSAVNEVADTRTVASTRYYNVAGIESNKPFDGMNIVVTTYTDGTTSTAKVVK